MWVVLVSLVQVLGAEVGDGGLVLLPSVAWWWWLAVVSLQLLLLVAVLGFSGKRPGCSSKGRTTVF